MPNNISSSKENIPDIDPEGILTSRKKIYISLGILAISIAYFAYIAFQGAAVFYLTIDELINSKTTANETVRVTGKLIPESFAREDQSTKAHFTITDGEKSLQSSYNGILPELFFNEHSDIVLEGRYNGNGTFNVSTVIVKCPSKYQAIEKETPA